MSGFLLDENLPRSVAEGLALLGFDVTAVGIVDGLATGATDAQVAKYCVENRRILVTKDRGRKNREMARLMKGTTVSVLQVPEKMTRDQFVRHFVRLYDRLTDEAERPLSRGGSYQRKLTSQGRLEPIA